MYAHTVGTSLSCIDAIARRMAIGVAEAGAASGGSMSQWLNGTTIVAFRQPVSCGLLMCTVAPLQIAHHHDYAAAFQRWCGVYKLS